MRSDGRDGEVEVDALRALERARCDAVSRGDLDALRAFLAPDLRHTHVNGMTQIREELLAGLRARPRTTHRVNDPDVRVVGDVAIMAGEFVNVFAPATAGGPSIEMTAHALQVWERRTAGWVLVAFAASGAPPSASD